MANTETKATSYSSSPTTGASSDNSFATQIYNAISNAIGGSNANQFLCLQIPGTILYENDYAYDPSKNETKSRVIQVNESRLANKMFDPCRMTGSDNGFSLPYQYKTALDMLTPKINKDIAKYKNELRQLLLNDYPYDFGNDVKENYTLQEVYFKLYDEYIEELKSWSQKQSKKREELKKKYSNSIDRETAFIEWYEEEAEKELNIINEKKSKVLSVFSPNDMKILEGVLDSGTGAELQEAREALINVRRINPNGGYIYPVRFIPEDWSKMLGTSFTTADLIKSVDALTSDLQILSLRRRQLYSYIVSISKLLKNQFSTIADVLAQIEAKQEQITENEKTITDICDQRIVKVIRPLADLKYKKVWNSLIKRLTTNVQISIDQKIQTALVNNLNTILTNENKLNDEYINLQKLLLKQYIEVRSHTDINSKEKSLWKKIDSLINPVIKQIEDIDNEIDSIKEQLQISSFFEEQKDDLSGINAQPLIPKGFSQIQVNATLSQINESTTYSVSKDTFTNGTSFLFLGRGNHISEEYNLLNNTPNCDVHITMNISKIGFERDWFNPAVFALTKDMLKLGNSKISPSKKDYKGITEARLSDMENCVFPCYPVAMIIARDIIIKFTFETEDKVAEYYTNFEKHAQSGGGFLLFQNSNINSSSKNSCIHTSTQDNSIIVKIDSTQLIGYYLEATRPDESVPFETISDENILFKPIPDETAGGGREVYTTENRSSSILEFVKQYDAIIQSRVNSRHLSTFNTTGSPKGNE